MYYIKLEYLATKATYRYYLTETAEGSSQVYIQYDI